MFTIELARQRFCVRNRFDYVRDLCADYLIEDAPDAVPVTASDEDLQYENQDGGRWSDAYLESLAVYRQICETAIEKDILLFHSSALALDGEGVLFTAPSGTGKSTHARLWRQTFGERVVTVNDDKPLLSFSEGEVRVWGTPYGGKDNLQNNLSAPVRAIVILHQAPENTVRRLTAGEAFPRLLTQAYRPRQAAGCIKALDLVERLSRLPVYDLGCTISSQAVDMCYEAVFGGEKTL